MITAFACGLICAQGAYGEGETLGSSKNEIHKITAVSFVSWWSHDATGYHPAIILKLENDSGRDLSGMLVKFQARFTDLRNGYVTIGRKEMRRDFANHQQIYVVLKGPQTFELPIDDNLWPTIECKIMCRVGEIGDEGTQTLLICRLESQTMTDEEAMSQLSKQPDIRRAKTKIISTNRLDEAKSTKSAQGSLSGKALAAKALALPSVKAKHRTNFLKEHLPWLQHRQGVARLPGLGDDFLEFDKVFGRAEQWDTSAGWTWVPYESVEPQMRLFVGAKGRGAKADVIIAKVKERCVKQESQLISLAKSLSGKFAKENLLTLNSSVKYLPTGRTQVTKLKAPSYQALLVSPWSNTRQDHDFLLIVCRLNDNLEALMPYLTRSSRMLSFMTPIFSSDAL